MTVNLSYSTINSVILCPHSWLTKQMGLEQVTSPYAEIGKDIHRIIQAHISGKDIRPTLVPLNLPVFPVVEEEDFDERLKVTFQFNENYSLRGFVDGRTENWDTILEIKTSKDGWTAGKFANSMQRKIYPLMKPEIKEVVMITTPRDIENWKPEQIKVYRSGVSEKDLEDAKEFIEKGIYIIEHINEQKLHEDQPNWNCYTLRCPYCHANQE